MPATLYERLGGEERIDRFARDLVANHYCNPLFKTRFEAIKDRAVFERHVKEFICMGTGGPQTYTGKDVLSAHKHMNINEQELVSAIDDMVAAMTKNNYGQTEINEMVALLYSLKGDVLHV